LISGWVGLAKNGMCRIGHNPAHEVAGDFAVVAVLDFGGGLFDLRSQIRVELDREIILFPRSPQHAASDCAYEALAKLASPGRWSTRHG
jgi:hypothetical protein